MYKTDFLSNDLAKIAENKNFSKKLNKVKAASKKNYFDECFALCKNNLKATRKLIGTFES